jgi:hypothetical protein
LWAVFAAALLALLRRRRWPGPVTWRVCHILLAGVIVVASVVHAVLIDGTMGLVSKTALCALVLGAAAKVIADARLPADLRRMVSRQTRQDG